MAYLFIRIRIFAFGRMRIITVQAHRITVVLRLLCACALSCSCSSHLCCGAKKYSLILRQPVRYFQPPHNPILSNRQIPYPPPPPPPGVPPPTTPLPSPPPPPFIGTAEHKLCVQVQRYPDSGYICSVIVCRRQVDPSDNNTYGWSERDRDFFVAVRVSHIPPPPPYILYRLYILLLYCY